MVEIVGEGNSRVENHVLLIDSRIASQIKVLVARDIGLNGLHGSFWLFVRCRGVIGKNHGISSLATHYITVDELHCIGILDHFLNFDCFS